MIDTSETWKQTFLYDRYGNRNFDTTNNNTTTLLPGCPISVCNPAVNQTNNRLIGYAFDNSGNTTTDAENRTFTYDAENKQIQVNDANGIVGQYFYDGDGKRIKKIVPDTGEETIFIYDAAGKLVAEYSTIIASATEAKVSYLTNDHLGSPRITTDATGQVISRRDFHPFGEEVFTSQRTQGLSYTADTVRQKFTGYERDNEIGLDFAQARYYSSRLGRFYSVDPESAGAMEDYPQSWNAYAYVGNNPLNMTDPDGEKWKVCDNQGNCVEISDAEARKTLFNRSGNHPEIIRKNGKIFDEDGNVSGTYVRTSFDDLSDEGNALIFGRNSIPAQADKKGRTVRAAAAAAGAVGVCIGTGGIGCAVAKEGAEAIIELELGVPLDVSTLRRRSTKGRSTKGKTTLYERRGGMNQANTDFDSLRPSNVQTRPGGIRTGTLQDGSKVTVRPNSTDGRPTLEVRKSNGRGDEFRYDP